MTATEPLLAIETSGGRGSVALLLPSGEVTERFLEGRTGHGKGLVPAMKELVREAGLSPGDVRVVAVSAGPGSYTGVRIGVTAAKMLAWTLRARPVAVSSLEALAAGAAEPAPRGTRRLVPAVDARRGQVYAAFFAFDHEGGTGTRKGPFRVPIHREGPDQVLRPERLASLLRPGDHVFGTAVASLAEELGGRDGVTTSTEPDSPTASHVALLGRELAARGGTPSPHDLAPVYLRRSEAEIKRGLEV